MLVEVSIDRTPAARCSDLLCIYTVSSPLEHGAWPHYGRHRWIRTAQHRVTCPLRLYSPWHPPLTVPSADRPVNQCAPATTDAHLDLTPRNVETGPGCQPFGTPSELPKLSLPCDVVMRFPQRTCCCFVADQLILSRRVQGVHRPSHPQAAFVLHARAAQVRTLLPSPSRRCSRASGAPHLRLK